MRFGAPFGFLALLIVPLWIAAFLFLERRRQSRVARAGDPTLIEMLVLADRDGGRSKRVAQAVLFAVALALVGIAVARPQLGMRSESRKVRGIDLVIALDLSKSMLARDVVPSRLDRARIEITELVGRLKGDRVGLVGFTSVALPLCPLTVDQGALLLQLKSAEPEDLPRGGTAIGEAITAAERMLSSSKASGAERAILVITDGEDNEGDALAVAKSVHDKGMVVHVVGVGSRSGEPIPMIDESGKVNGYVKDRAGQTVVSRLNEKLLRDVAEAGGGLVTIPSEAGGLDLAPIRAHLSQLKKAEIDERSVRVYEERYQWVLAPAFLLLLIATLLRPSRPTRMLVSNLAGVARKTAMMTLIALLIGAGPLEREDEDAKVGNAALAAGKHKEATEAYTKALGRIGDDPRLLLNRGLAEAQGGEIERATSDLRAAMEAGKDPTLRAEAAYALGNAYRKLKKYDESIESYRRALLESPGHSGARRNLEITQRMKTIQALQPKDPNQKNENKDQPPSPNDGGPSDGGQDAGPNDASGNDGSSGDGGQDPADGGGSGDSGGESDKQQDGGGASDSGSGSASNDSADAGGASDGGSPESSEAQEQEPPKDPDKKQAEDMLDAVKDREKALKRKRLLQKITPKQVEKDW